MEKYRSRKLVDLEKELQIKLKSVLDNEELLWKQKSRSNWLTLGDCPHAHVAHTAHLSEPVPRTRPTIPHTPVSIVLGWRTHGLARQ
ncbi:hypothetical protein PVK06_030138 [Gossypium arboreum]|uniref:Uncharacterized protein n=1 Tax=Gossypium arboreum TaxID=29729 RepID=A0ABR0NND3_GOSAR|nr:hypothetical protein PVK06_030138 [Gossypium arboreum]